MYNLEKIGSFILQNQDLVLISLYGFLFILFIIWDYQIFNKLLKKYKSSIKDNFAFIEIIIKYQLEKKKLKEQIKDLQNQKRVEKYYNKKRFLALDLAVKNFGNYKEIKRKYYKLNRQNLSQLKKLKKNLEKNK